MYLKYIFRVVLFASLSRFEMVFFAASADDSSTSIKARKGKGSWHSPIKCYGSIETVDDKTLTSSSDEKKIIAISSIAIKGNLALLGYQDGSLALIEIIKRKDSMDPIIIKKDQSRLRALGFALDDTHFFTGGDDGIVTIFSFCKGKGRRFYYSHLGGVVGGRYAVDNSHSFVCVMKSGDVITYQSEKDELPKEVFKISHVRCEDFIQTLGVTHFSDSHTIVLNQEIIKDGKRRSRFEVFPKSKVGFWVPCFASSALISTCALAHVIDEATKPYKIIFIPEDNPELIFCCTLGTERVDEKIIYKNEQQVPFHLLAMHQPSRRLLAAGRSYLISIDLKSGESLGHQYPDDITGLICENNGIVLVAAGESLYRFFL